MSLDDKTLDIAYNLVNTNDKSVIIDIAFLRNSSIILEMYIEQTLDLTQEKLDEYTTNISQVKIDKDFLIECFKKLKSSIDEEILNLFNKKLECEIEESLITIFSDYWAKQISFEDNDFIDINIILKDIFNKTFDPKKTHDYLFF